MMTFVESIQTCFKKYACFTGRAARSEYWWFILFYFVLAFVAALINQNLYGLVVLAMFLPLLAVSVRRLHDTNRSGWWVLLGLIPVIGIIILIWWYATPGTSGPNQY